jgi:hypothetical protein
LDLLISKPVLCWKGQSAVMGFLGGCGGDGVGGVGGRLRYTSRGRQGWLGELECRSDRMVAHIKKTVQEGVDLVIVEAAVNDPYYNEPWPRNKMR